MVYVLFLRISSLIRAGPRRIKGAEESKLDCLLDLNCFADSKPRRAARSIFGESPSVPQSKVICMLPNVLMRCFRAFPFCFPRNYFYNGENFTTPTWNRGKNWTQLNSLLFFDCPSSTPIPFHSHICRKTFFEACSCLKGPMLSQYNNTSMGLKTSARYFIGYVEHLKTSCGCNVLRWVKGAVSPKIHRQGDNVYKIQNC